MLVNSPAGRPPPPVPVSLVPIVVVPYPPPRHSVFPTATVTRVGSYLRGRKNPGVTIRKWETFHVGKSSVCIFLLTVNRWWIFFHTTYYVDCRSTLSMKVLAQYF